MDNLGYFIELVKGLVEKSVVIVFFEDVFNEKRGPRSPPKTAVQ